MPVKYSSPLPFKEALSAARGRQMLPTSLSAAELAQVPAALRRASLFSARTLYIDHLNKIFEMTDDLVKGEVDTATARLALKQSIEGTGYRPDPEIRGTLQDLSSEARLKLVINTQREMAQGYGYWKQNQQPEILDQWPCQELIRVVDPANPANRRDWITRWRNEGGRVFAGWPEGYPLTADGQEGRCIARVDDEIWTRISRFGNPYAPFDYRSGVDVRPVSRPVAEDLGVIERGERAEPQDIAFDENLQATVKVASPELRQAVLESLGEGFKWDGDVLASVS